MEVYLEYSRDHRGTFSKHRKDLWIRSHGTLKRPFLELFQTTYAIGEKSFVERFRAYVGTLLQCRCRSWGRFPGILLDYFQRVVLISGKARRI
jgi:hypothetical protein